VIIVEKEVDGPMDFAGAVKQEALQIDCARRKLELPTTSAEPASIEVARRDRGDEPWVAYTPFDRAGIALSGGGIRSSAFTLGLLQALAERNVLRLFDYLATVSGGGYTGGFWTSWVRANPGTPFPVAGSGCNSREPMAIRHLREHSRFLAPRTGVGYIDLWEAVLALLAGMMPTLAFATLLFATGVVAWRALVAGVVGLTFVPFMPSIVVFVGYVVVDVLMERRWQSIRLVPSRPTRWATVLGAALITSTLLAAVTWYAARPASVVWHGDPVSPGSRGGYALWLAAAQYPVSGLDWIRGYLLPAGFAIGAAAVWTFRWVGALLVGWWGQTNTGAAMRRPDDPTALARGLERSSARLLFFSLLALGFALIWHLSMFLVSAFGNGASGLLESIGVSGGLTALASASFAALRNLLQPSREDDAAGLLARVRPVLPQLAAVVTVGLYLTSVTIVCYALDRHLLESRLSVWLWLAVPAIVLALAFSDHRGSGLHEFYRRRISRAFVQYAGDELPEGCDVLQSEASVRPVHLVCCAANGVSDDPLRTLYRGARSAVLSQHGLLIGSRAIPADIRLSDALTASAAAFNSQMGGYSVRLGAAVSILMTALNLRLGLWLATTTKRTLLSIGGVRVIAEMFGLTQSDHSWVHLSDGGHFDNTGAYELVRRHCRYIVIADCGADPKVRFDDIGELIRRVREDFGVEIEVDVSPLRPGADGYSRQHVAVGKIFYGGRATNDIGTLIVVKPTLTGDEPPDVTQYHARNSAFPHESTGDQFFDEPQWESYRRLGEHTGRSVFAYVKDLSPDQINGGERVFTDAGRMWHAMPPGFAERLGELSSRCAALEQELRGSMHSRLRGEFVPELAGADGEAATVVDEHDDARTFMFLLDVASVLEDAWHTCGLDAHAQHPLNEGWSAYIGRWVAMPSFMRMWPLLRPLVAPGFREFVKRRFGLRVRDVDEAPASGLTNAEGTAVLELVCNELSGCATQSFELVYRLTLPGSPSTSTVVGRATVEMVGDIAKWRLDSIVVPERMNGAGVVGRFLDAILVWCAQRGCTRAVARARIDVGGSLADHNRVLDLYRGRGFWLSPLGPILQRNLPPPPPTRDPAAPSA
jgi:hypothetical protein